MKSQSLRATLQVIALCFPLYSAFPDLIGNSFGTATIYDVNTVTGAATNPRATGVSGGLAGIVYDSGSGIVYGLTASAGDTPNSLLTINPITGATVVVGATGLSQIAEGDIAFNPLTGFLYGVESVDPANNNTRDLFRIDSLTGAATVVGSLSSTLPSRDFSALAFDSVGTLYTIDTFGSGNSILSTVNPQNAALLSSVTMNVSLGSVAALAFDPISGTAYLVDGGTSKAGTNMLYTLDIATGVATPVGPLEVQAGLAGLTFVPQVPEAPVSAMLLIGLTFLGFGYWQRRNRCDV
jgi:hypothetical protein